MNEQISLIIFLGFCFAVFLWIRNGEKREFNEKKAKDRNFDYENKGIPLRKVDINGIDYFEAFHKDYQPNKSEAIKKLFVPGEVIRWSGAQWEVISTPNYKLVDERSNTKYERPTHYYSVKVRYISALDERSGDLYNYGIISEFNGSTFYNSDVTIENQVEIKNELLKTIDQFLQSDSENEAIAELKRDLKLLKYEVQNNEVDTQNLPSLITKMKTVAQTTAPFASLLSAIIGLVQKFMN